jgi:hypothetical protein
VNTVVYIRQMETSGEYSLQDLREFDVQSHFEDAINFDAVSGIEVLFEFKGPGRLPTDGEIANYTIEYEGRGVELFQILFQQYVDPDYVIDTDPNAFADMQVL